MINSFVKGSLSKTNTSSDAAQAKPLEQTVVQVVKQPIKSSIVITKIPREKYVNVSETYISSSYLK